MGKRRMSEQEAVSLVTSTAGVSIVNKVILFDRAAYKGFNSLRVSGAYDCLKNYYGYK